MKSWLSLAAGEMVKLMEQDGKNRLQAEPDEATELHGNLAGYLQAKPELGLAWRLADLALEPRNPFKPNVRRKARKGFVVTVLFATAFIAWFAWFNLIR